MPLYDLTYQHSVTIPPLTVEEVNALYIALDSWRLMLQGGVRSNLITFGPWLLVLRPGA